MARRWCSSTIMMHDGQREESVFVVRDKSEGLLDAVNAFVKRTPFPLHMAPSS